MTARKLLISRRRFLQTSTLGGTAFAGGGVFAPFISHAARSADGDAWRAVRRCVRRQRHDLGAHRPAGADAGRSLHDRVVPQCGRAAADFAALPESDFCAKRLIENLPAGQTIFYRVKFRDLAQINVESEPVVGRFRTAPADRRDVSFVWGGDVAGQGWGINPDDGGMTHVRDHAQA